MQFMQFEQLLLLVVIIIIYLSLYGLLFRTIRYKTEEQFRRHVKKLSVVILLLTFIGVAFLTFRHFYFLP